MNDLPLIDMLTMTVLFGAVVRGVWIGLVREGLSLAAIGLCTIVTRLFLDPVTARLTELTGGEVSGKAAVWISAVLLIMATVIICGLIARLIRRGVQFAGLGWADRIGGGALGLAEGSIIAAILVIVALWLVGPEHPTTEGARSVEIVENWRSAHAEGSIELPSVAAPGSWF